MKASAAKLYFRLFLGFLSALLIVSSAAQPVYPQKKRTKAKKTVKKRSVKKKTNRKKSRTAAERRRRAAAKKAAEKKRRAAERARRLRQERIRRARARKVAFERSLRAETARNIGADELNGEDAEIRRVAIEALGRRAGTVVVMEAQTGRILTIVNQDWAIRQGFKPCSTIKLVTAIAGLNEELITADGNLRDRNYRLDLNDALAYSNNSYFQLVGRDLGSEKMIFYARLLGLGQKTGINAGGEAIGRLPHGNSSARIYSHGDSYRVTPLQLGVMVSTIANGGRLIVPQIARSRVKKTGFQGFMRRQVRLPMNSLQGVIPGMIGAAEYGTARRGVDPEWRIAGKTGSCIAHGSWIGLFASVAPIENPQYAVVVITRGQNERGKYAAAVAGEIYRTLGQRFDPDRNRRLARRLALYKPLPKVDAKTSARIDAEAGEDSDDADTSPSDQKIIVINRRPKQPKITRQPSRKKAELFPPVIIRKKSNGLTRPRIVKEIQ